MKSDAQFIKLASTRNLVKIMMIKHEKSKRRTSTVFYSNTSEAVEAHM
jgi:hypothetical protein